MLEFEPPFVFGWRLARQAPYQCAISPTPYDSSSKQWNIFSFSRVLSDSYQHSLHHKIQIFTCDVLSFVKKKVMWKMYMKFSYLFFWVFYSADNVSKIPHSLHGHMIVASIFFVCWCNCSPLYSNLCNSNKAEFLSARSHLTSVTLLLCGFLLPRTFIIPSSFTFIPPGHFLH